MLTDFAKQLSAREVEEYNKTSDEVKYQATNYRLHLAKGCRENGFVAALAASDEVPEDQGEGLQPGRTK